MKLRNVFLSLGFFAFLVVGWLALSIQSEPALAQQSFEPVTIGNRPILQQGFSQPPATQTRALLGPQPASHSPFIVNNTQLLRTAYLLPPDAAELLNKLFEHKSTVLVESRILENDGKESKGLVKFEVTAEPQTQHAIQSFLMTVFPKKKLETLMAQDLEPVKVGSSETGRTYTVTLSLPNMTCGGCAASVKNFLTNNKFGDFEVDVAKRTVQLSLN